MGVQLKEMLFCCGGKLIARYSLKIELLRKLRKIAWDVRRAGVFVILDGSTLKKLYE